MSDRTSRRRFIQQGAFLSASSLLAGCVHVDRYLLGDQQDDSNRVVILGAGLAGLMAARELKKQGIPFRIYEAADRVGGRVYTLGDFNSASQIAEMGAEWFGADDQLVRDLCKEYRLQTSESSSNSGFFWNHHWLEPKEIADGLQQTAFWIERLQSQMTPEILDQMNLEELSKRIRGQVPDWIPLFLRRSGQLQCGVDPDQISALAWLDQYKNGVPQIPRSKIVAGSSSLVQALYDRLAGVIPGRLFRMGWRLSEISQRMDQLLNLTFETPEGSRTIQAKVVICTIPFSVLRGISGINDIEFSENKKKLIQNLGYGTHAKIALSFAEKNWPTKKQPARWTGDFESQWIWEASPRTELLTSPRGILMAQLGGHWGQEAGLHSIEQVKKDLIQTKLSVGQSEEASQVINWKNMSYAQGSVSFLKPRQISLYSEAAKAELKGTFVFAGEHTSEKKRGTMQGALESGFRAAQEVEKFRPLFDKLS